MGLYTTLQIVPVGTIATWPSSSIPSGWLLCDGSPIDRVIYGSLFAMIGITHGQGNGTTSFNIPDYRGRFLRGWANASTVDPDKTGRVAMNTGGNAGNNLATLQGTAIPSHIHGFWIRPAQGGSSAGGSFNTIGHTGFRPGVSDGVSFATSTVAGNSMPLPISSTTGESRPINAYVNFIIKY